MWDELVKNLNLKSEDFKLGILGGISIIIAILLILSSGSLTYKGGWTKDEYKVTPDDDRAVLGFPSYDNPTLFQFYVLNSSGECLNSKIKLSNGIERYGKYCEGDEILIENKILVINQILNSDNIEKPITVSIYTVFNIASIFSILIFVIPIIGIWYKINCIQARKEDERYFKKRKELAKKFKVKEEDIDDLLDFSEGFIEDKN